MRGFLRSLQEAAKKVIMKRVSKLIMYKNKIFHLFFKGRWKGRRKRRRGTAPWSVLGSLKESLPSYFCYYEKSTIKELVFIGYLCGRATRGQWYQDFFHKDTKVDRVQHIILLFLSLCISWVCLIQGFIWFSVFVVLPVLLLFDLLSFLLVFQKEDDRRLSPFL